VRTTALASFVVLALALFAAPSNPDRAAPVVGPAQAWLAYGHDAQLTNFVRFPGLTPATAHRLKQVWTKKLDGSVIASPLYVSGGLIGLPSSTSIVIAATEVGTVYALRPSNGAVRWKRTFGVVTPAALCNMWGISSTGAIDLRRRVLYVISADGWLHALDLGTGAEKAGWPIAITADHADADYVWGGLRLLRDTLYVPVASYCDGPGADGVEPNGRLVAVDVNQAAQSAVFDPVPGDGNLGGIWGWGGVSVDPKGQTLYTGVGNSHVYDAECDCYVDDAGYGDSMVKLTPTLRVLDWNRPKPSPPTGDFDFGSAPLLFQPPGCPPLAAGNSKIGVMYVWNRDRLGNGPSFQRPIGEGPASFVGQPSYAPALRMIFESHASVVRNGRRIGDGIRAFSVDRRCRFHFRWLKSVGLGNEPPPLILGDVVFAPGGDRGGYTALAARTGKVLWRFPTAGSTYAPAIAAGGRIFAGDLGGTLHVFARGAAKRPS
jgi:outer membrane protein assembly factor BamB